MKISRDRPDFEPVTITLENAQEVTWLLETARKVCVFNRGGEARRVFFDDLKHGLELIELETD